MIRSFHHHLSSEFKEYWLDYVVLGAVLLIGIAAFWIFSAQSTRGTAVALLLAVFYFFWGVIHHALKKDLHLKVVIEYFLISLLGLVVFFSLIKRL